MEIVRIESQEYTLQDKLWFKHETSKASLENPGKGLISSPVTKFVSGENNRV